MKPESKIVLSASRDIPLNQLLLSQANVRRVKAGVSIEELAEDIARRGLLQGLSVRAVIDAEGAQTGMFEIPAGGRRFRALELLVKQKRMNKTTPVPCIVRDTGVPEEDSLAENVQRAPLHPLDQFRAFQRLREKGESEEEIAAAFFVPVSVVKQRLRLASVSDKLLDIYADDGMTLDQLMAFTVSGDHARQEAVFERVEQGYDKAPYIIRRMLTETAVRACDKRAQFIGIDAYVEAGGCVMRDLFQSDEGGWLQDASLVELMVAERLRDEAEQVRAEGWKWIEVAPDFPYGHTYGLRQLRGQTVDLSPEQQATRDALQAELDALEAEWAETSEDLPEEVDARLGEIEAALDSLDRRPVAYDPDEIARAGAFVSIDGGGNVRIERGYVRAEDEVPVQPEPDSERVGDTGRHDADSAEEGVDDDGSEPFGGQHHAAPPIEPEEEDGIKPLSDRLLAELTAHRTLGLRHVLGERPDIAVLAVTHALALQTFYLYPLDSCVEIRAGRRALGNAPGLADSPAAVAVGERHQALRDLLPSEPGDLWRALLGMERSTAERILAHCVAENVNAVVDPYERRPRALAHADQLASAVALDMAAQGWTPTVDGYLGRVTKARILAAVAEGVGSQAVERIGHLKKGEMAEAAEPLLAGTGWLPEPLRTQRADPEQVMAFTGEDVAPGKLVNENGSDDLIAGEPDAQTDLDPSCVDSDAFGDELEQAIAAE